MDANIKYNSTLVQTKHFVKMWIYIYGRRNMKRFCARQGFFVLIVFLLIYKAASASWEWQNPLPQGNILSSVWLASSNSIYAVGYGNTIIESSDGARTGRLSIE